jgi:hypothetical protein
MVSQLNSKRVWCVLGLMSATLMIVVGVIAYSAAPNSVAEREFPAPKNVQCISSPSSAAHNDHPRPWLKVVVSHVISVATRLAV